MNPHAINVMVKPRGSLCNLACKYCFYLKKERLYPNHTFRMSDALLEEWVRQYIASQSTREVTFAWQGGEPTLMGLDFFRKAVKYQANYRRPGMQVCNAFQTNGILLNEEWCGFLHEQQFLVGLSIDGPQKMHDTYRLDKGGQPTFAQVMRAAGLLRQHQVAFNTLTCVSAANAAQGLEVYRFLRDEVQSRFMQFIPIVERDNDTGFQEGTRLTARSVAAEQYGRFMIDIYDEWVRRDVGQVFVQLFDVTLAAWLGQRPGLCVFEETCGEALAMEFNGDLYSCDHYVEPDGLLGNIHQTPLTELAGSAKQQAFGLAKRDRLPRMCQECAVRFICNGGCPKDRVLTAPNGESGLNALCAGYRAFFTYSARGMNMMAALLHNGRAPAEILHLLANDPPLRDLPPFGPCPCGSGRTVATCHGGTSVEQPRTRKRH